MRKTNKNMEKLWGKLFGCMLLCSWTTRIAPKKAEPSTDPIYLGSYLKPWEYDTEQNSVQFFFENAELAMLIKYVEEQFSIKIITDDDLQPLPQGGKSILGTKITFKTHKALSKKEAWSLFITFLEMAGVAIIPGPGPKVYKLVPSHDPKSPQNFSHAPLPTFIGVDPSLVPNNDTRIRYVYFVENASLETIKNILDSMKSVTAPNLMPLPELNAIIITDKAANIKAMLAVVKELDQANMPEALAVVKLKRTDASKAAQLYRALADKDSGQGITARILGTRRLSTAEYFSEGTRVIPEPRTNSLIILGARESIAKIVDFMKNVVDEREGLPEMPLYIDRLKHLDSDAMARILQEATRFQPNSEAGKAGGVRDDDKYMKPVSIVSEKSTNSLIINAEYEDYSKIHDLIVKMDVEQPQVALKVFILNTDISNKKAFGVQLRNKIPGISGLIGDNTNFQTTGLTQSTGQLVEDTSTTGSARLLGDLINLATGVANGSTVVSLGSDKYGVWGILNMLQTYTSTTVVANPFLVTTHKYPAQFTLGETRYVEASTVFGTTGDRVGFTDISANLTVSITPQVSSDGLVTLDVEIHVDEFANPDPASKNANRTERKIKTSVIVADNEVLALGGLIKETVRETESRVPLLGSIPLLGWLFKNRSKTIERTSVLVLILPEIIRPADTAQTDMLTRKKLLDSQDLLEDLRSKNNQRDPIHRWFFQDQTNESSEFVEEFAKTKGAYTEAATLGLDTPYTATEPRKRSLTENLLETKEPA